MPAERTRLKKVKDEVDGERDLPSLRPSRLG